ncbi:L-rhamnose/proton symporter RhaT [Sphingosinicella terrae]|uniref:L-rhamnose/proton symporter RhaT n=1 Tax=Sphingosinicella terrae TaxID=2172047 RepID=UPI000E0D2842|nr:L-rhamnose/proton symporter RhaT [Sphingosinicella terrae]
MTPNPLLGLLFHWLGGLASASFYVPFRWVRHWSWEIYWLTAGLFSWLFVPWIVAALRTEDLLGVLAAADAPALVWPVVFGMLWGFGGLTYGLTMRYLGLSLGMAVVLGLCTVFGTLIPPLFQGDFADKLLATTSGNIVLAGILVTLAGIVVVALAGSAKDSALSPDQKAEAVAEFDFRKGIWVAIFSGIMSSCFAFGLAAGEPVGALSAAAGTGPLWAGLPVLCLVMFGGLVTNSVWCAILIGRNRSFGQWLGRAAPLGPPAAALSAAPAAPARPPLGLNFLLCAIAGSAWYFQFFFYTMGESQMGRYGFSSWTLHMASIIIFGTLWGFAFREWKDAAPRVKATVWSGVGLLVLATIVIGYGNSLAT